MTMRYRAFLSYSRADNRMAGWLHQKLDSYRTPRSLVGVASGGGNTPAKLHPVFRDRTDLPGGGELTARIHEALQNSDKLIVLCSPSAAQSVWVNREIETFIQLGRAGDIFPVIIGGEPESADPALECFPSALRGRGLLAADVREVRLSGGRQIGDGREAGVLKLIAGLLGLPLDALVQRERRRQRMLVTLAGSAAVVFAAVSVVAVWQSLAAQHNAAVATRNADETALTAAQSLAQQSAQAISQKDYVGAFELAARGSHLYPEHALRFLTLIRWTAFATRNVEAFHQRVGTIIDESFSPNSELVASVSADGVLLVSDLKSGRIWESTVPAGHRFVSVAVSNTHVAVAYMPSRLNDDPAEAPGAFIDADEPADMTEGELNALVGNEADVREIERMPTTILVWTLDDKATRPLKLASDVGLDMVLEREQNVALSSDGAYVAGCGRSATTVYAIASGTVVWRATEAGEPTDWYASNCAFDDSSTYLGAVTSGVSWLYEAATGKVLKENGSIRPDAGEKALQYIGAMRFDFSSPAKDELLEMCDAQGAHSTGANDPVAYVYDTARSREFGLGGANLVADDADGITGESEVTRLGNVDLGNGRFATRSPFNYLTLSLAPGERERSCGRSVPDSDAFQGMHYATDEERRRMGELLAAENFPAPGLKDLTEATAWQYFNGSRFAVVADGNNRIAVYNVDTGRRQQLMQGASAPVAFALSHDGKSLFVQTKQGAEFWDAEFGLLVAKLPQVKCDAYCNAVGSFGPDDRSFSIITSDMGGGGEYIYPAPAFAMSLEAVTDLLCKRLFGPGNAAGTRPLACPMIHPPPISLPTM